MRAVLLAAGLAACAPNDSADSARPAAAPSGPGLLAQSVWEDGPFAQGHQRLSLSYLTPLGVERFLEVEVFYPTEADRGDPVRYDATFVDDTTLGNAAAAPPQSESGYPVVVHSHGHCGIAGGAGFWSRRLVSQGWVVIAPRHLGDTLQEGFPSCDYRSPASHYLERPADLTAAVDFVAASGALAGPLDLRALGASGHSRGAYSLWALSGATFDPDALAAACAGETSVFPTGSCTAEEEAVFLSGALADDRVVASLALDGDIRRGFFGDEGHRSLSGPFVKLSQADDAAGTRQAHYDSMDGIDYSWGAVEGACHESFNVVLDPNQGLQPCPTLDREVGLDITATAAAALFRSAVLGDDSDDTVGVLEGSISLDPAVTWQRRQPTP